jgi:hypothetical protein
VESVLLVNGAEFFYLQAAGGAPFILGGGIVAPLAFGALQLNYFSGHGVLLLVSALF